MTSTLPGVAHFGREVCGDLAQAERREWWLANGRGAYAAGTVALSLTRRYHGLLVAPLEPPLGRHLVLAKADATLAEGDREWPLFTNRWSDGTVAPAGHVHIESFRLEGRLPVWRFALGEARIEQRIWLEPGASTVYVAWRLDPRAEGDGGRGLSMRVNLLANDRDHHWNTRAGHFEPAIEETPAGVRASLASGHRLTLAAAGGAIRAARTWYQNFGLVVEADRGLDPVDNHLCVAQAELGLAPGRWVGVVASVETDCHVDLEAALSRALARERALLERAEAGEPALAEAPDWVRQLALAADSFLFARPLPEVPDGESVIAGYPWFGDWGRDTMIALPGLALVAGRPESARRILETFARFVDRGMLPNVFPGAGERAEYNSVDAALWYPEAWRAYLEATGDRASVEAALPVLEDIVRWHLEGTRYGVAVDPADGLLRAGEPGVQLTWMDAKVGEWVVTPRIGKPVEINALWFNALCVLADLLAGAGRGGEHDYRALAERVRRGFERFAKPDRSGLYDVIDGPNGDDTSVRPNQLFAVSLPHSPLDPPLRAAVLRQCARDLLTSYGLRSLSPDHPDYRPHYRGGVWERDGAYHQGTVWAWLLGPYALAEYRLHGDPVRAQARLEPIADHLVDAGLGTVSEIFEGAPPHRPCGAPSQAWSVACVLEAWVRLERARRAPTPPPPPSASPGEGVGGAS
jgi:4-alpha-glucanotransferase